MSVGKQVRMRRLLGPSGRMLAITIDHPITRGVLPGLEDIHGTMKKVVRGKPDAITMHKGIAEQAGRAATNAVHQTAQVTKKGTSWLTWALPVLLNSLDRVRLRQVFVVAFIAINIGYIWFVKDPQYEERAVALAAHGSELPRLREALALACAGPSPAKRVDSPAAETRLRALRWRVRHRA